MSNSMKQIILEKLIVAQLIKEFRRLLWKLKIYYLVHRAHHWSLS